ncbi:methylmalonic aciduria and homocystinuria type D homolog, mitochondrial [Scaptodrosophila lebanonensis]|uniref:Methylmalonic aciduria and homocystinuria type D homolog, mitochondrial n=1 Tax=Drosophila lebanonensis TaxID=7225 RepID=A0A6J2UDC9_DROLE|nr:methylmalonic aciduria and homocystinuria type D homolog, mitochondrial [Scaptodrosophila lebanonensis]
MSRTLTRFLGHFGRTSLVAGAHMKTLNSHNSSQGVRLLCIEPMQVMAVVCYSKRNGPPSDAGQPFKTVNKSRGVDDDDLNSLEAELNWELTSKHNRFYLPNSTGPAWQGDTSTVGLMEPLSKLVNFFQESNEDKTRLEFSCCQCPMLIRESLLELFPVRAVNQRDANITLITLSYEGDIELGATKFVLAARDISDRLLSLGYWSDFINPFSGRPYYVPRDGSKLYKQDYRFRGINMRLSMHNDCLVIAAEDDVNTCFSGTVYTTAPGNRDLLLELLLPSELQIDIDKVFE